MKSIATNRKTCPKCERDALRRKFRELWMTRLGVSKYYKCANCDNEFVVLFGYKFNFRLLLYSLLGIVSIFCTIVLLCVIVLICNAFEASHLRDLAEYLTPQFLEGF